MKEWYEKLKQDVGLEENQDIFNRVVESISTYFDFNPDEISQQLLWINGFHDFMMAGESMAMLKHPCIKTFYQSGHYPHFEEPQNFADQVKSFLD